MQHRWYAIALCGWMAGCASSPASSPASPPSDPGESKPVPDHFNENLDQMTRGATHPCGADLDYFDGQIVKHVRYTYDELGRARTDITVDPTGAVVDQIDYAWDNAGHLTKQRDAWPGSLQIDTSLYDTLGRLPRTQVTVSDTDPTDTQQVANTRSTEDYADFDALGHAADSRGVIEDLDAQTSLTLTSTYSYDDLGRLTSQETRSAAGDLETSVQLMYDDVAHTLTADDQLSAVVTGGFAGRLHGVTQYDRDGHWLSTHITNSDSNGVVFATEDTEVTWDGDRELEELTTISPPDQLWTLHLSKIFNYQCDSAPLATARPSASAPRALPRFPFLLSPFRRRP